VAVLTRISTDELNQPYSLEAQAAGLDAFVASQPGHTITHRFVDQASGATLARPGLQAALAAAKTGQFDVLLVYRIDRLTRSIVGLMSIVEELDAAGVALRSATEPIDTQGPVGRMLLQLLGIFAEFERGLLIDRITKGFERKAARGEWLGGPGPYGYQLDSASKTLTVEAGEAAVVRAIYARYTDERSGAPGLAHWLNDTGRRSRRCRLWSTQTVLRVLRNPVYVGKIVHGEDLHEGKHEPILDKATFARAQLLLQAGSAESPAVRPNSSDYLLSGLLRCTACHGAYVGAGAHGRGGFYRYYVCRTGQAKGAHACAGPRIQPKTSRTQSPPPSSTPTPTAGSSNKQPPTPTPTSKPNCHASTSNSPPTTPNFATQPPPSTDTSAPSKPEPCPTTCAHPASPNCPPGATNSPPAPASSHSSSKQPRPP